MHNEDPSFARDGGPGEKGGGGLTCLPGGDLSRSPVLSTGSERDTPNIASTSTVAEVGGRGGEVLEGGEERAAQHRNKWEARPKVTIARNEKLRRNVLEINQEVDSSAKRIDTELVAKLFQKMGLKVGLGGNLEGLLHLVI